MPPKRADEPRWSGHEFRHTPQRGYIKELLDEGYIGKFRLCTIELFLDRYVTPQPRPLTWQASKAAGGGLLGALGSHYIDGLRHWFGDVASVVGQVEALRPDVMDAATNRIVKSETDDTFLFTLQFRNGGIATMISSFAATPTRGAKIVVMGDNGTLIAEQPGPNPEENGVVVGSRGGSPLQALETPKKYTPFTDARDHRLDGVSASGPRLHDGNRAGHVARPQLHRRPALPGSARRRARVVAIGTQGSVASAVTEAAATRVAMTTLDPTVAAVVRKQTGVAWSRARSLCAEGRVTVNGERCLDAASRVPPGATGRRRSAGAEASRRTARQQRDRVCRPRASSSSTSPPEC